MQNIGVGRSNADHRIRCARCGAERLIPLTVHYVQPEHRIAQRVQRPVRAELKCVACGHRHHVPPRVLLTI
jgi:DNA-directed RNA polymerase subunit RPC12/RpoP